MNDLTKLLTAVDFAAKKHRSQKRKGSEEIPYINHPVEVASQISNIGDFHDIKVLCAAILHDTVEDTDATAEEIVEIFGADVCKMVLEVTDDKSLPKAERKLLQIEHSPHLSDGAKHIKLSDKICNIRDVTNDPPAFWSLERREDYLNWAEKVVAGVRGVNENLEGLFDQLLAEGRMKIQTAKENS